MSQSQGKSLRLSTQKKPTPSGGGAMCLLIHITFLCRPSASNHVTSLEAPVEAWGAFENFTPLIKCMPDPVEKKKERRERN